MSLATQTLPAGESFEKPDWTAKTVGSALDNCAPFYFWHAAWNVSNGLKASDSEYSSCPFKVGGQLECADFGTLFRSSVSGANPDMPAHMTDTTGGDQSKKRGLILREEDSFNHDGLSVEAQFGCYSTGAGVSGSTQQGSGGSSPRPGSIRPFPTVSTSGSTSFANTSLVASASGVFSGPPAEIDPIRSPGTEGWAGNAVAIRCGGGRPGLAASDPSPALGSQWSWRTVSGYFFAAYPVKNGTAQDLYLELWRITTNSSTEQIPRLLCKQVLAGAGGDWLRDRPYRMRVEVVNVGSNPAFTAYISDFTVAGVAAERQCFKDGVFPASVISVGPSGDGGVVAGTGVVTDSGTDKISAFADKTAGVVMGRDRAVNTSTFTVAGGIVEVVEGLYRLTGKRTDTAAIVYNDLFDRIPTPSSTGVNFDAAVLGLYTYGNSLMGMFQSDAGGAEVTAGNTLTNKAKITKSLVWTSSVTDISSPNDYITFFYDPTPTANDSLANAPRIAWHKRPSTQYFNHHPIVSFVGATDSGSGGVVNTFSIGVVARGTATQTSQYVILFYALYTTDGSGAQTSLKLRVSMWAGSYNQNPAVNEVVLAESVIHSSGSPPAGYDIAGGTKRTMGLRAERYDEGSTPSSAAQYTAYWGGTALAFTTLNQNCTQDGTSKVITHPSPEPLTTYGRAEGFMFMSVQPKQAGATVHYVDPKFEDWTEGAMTADPEVEVGGATISVAGEGSPSVNLSTVVTVDWAISVDYPRPKYTAVFESGHTYASPVDSKARRVIKARAANIPKATFDALVAFYDARGGIGGAFYFDFPIPSSLSSNVLTQIPVAFTSSGLKTSRKAEGVYDVTLEMVELFI